jgi:aminoglycoside 3-N-acetyltransferase
MLTIEDFNSALEILELDDKPAIAHASLKSFGAIRGGAEAVVGALLASVSGLIMPAFTYKTMLIPEVGPPSNGLAYGKHSDLNRMAEPFHYDMPIDPLIGTLPETLRHYSGAMRTAHPILSFVGFNANAALETQTLYNPFAPIGWLADRDGWVLLMGVDHTVDTSIHYGEKMAGRHQFVRWALTRKRVVECPNFPGCSDGFEAIRPEIVDVTRRVEVGESFIEAIPLHPILQAVETSIKSDPLALLCQRERCERCDVIRHVVTET